MNVLALTCLGIFGLMAVVGLLVVGLRNREEEDPLASRLSAYGSELEVSTNLEEIEMSVPFTERVLLPMAQSFAKFTTQFTPAETLAKTQQQITLAGSPKGLTPALLWTMRLGAMFGLSAFLTILTLITDQRTLFTILALVGGAAVGFLLPQMWLSSKITRRQQEVVKSLPDALDLMSICVNAGLGFDQAMAQVYEKWDNELALAFGRVVQEIQVGKTRRQALRAMDANLGVPDVTTFVGAIIQADQLGVSISRILNIQADQMRVKRRQRAQEKAQQAPVKMMFPLVFFIFPSIWIVLLGPAAVQLFKAFF
jgi:tight adherence protein C